MTTVTGLTAARMEAIEAMSVVDGEVVGDDLILKRFDESTINAGNVRGPMPDASDFVQQGIYALSPGNLTVGTGGSPINEAQYTFVGGSDVGDIGILNIKGNITLGTTGAVTGSVNIDLPSGFQVDERALSSTLHGFGWAFMQDNNGDDYWGIIRYGSATRLILSTLTPSTHLTSTNTSASSPFTWAAGDSIRWNATLSAVRV